MIFFTHEKRKLLAHFMCQRAASCHHSFSLDAVVNPAAHRGRSIISQLCYPYWSAKAKSGYSTFCFWSVLVFWHWVITVLEYLIYLFFLKFVPKQRNIFWFYKYQFWSTDEEDEKSSNSSANGHTRNMNPSEFDYFHSAAISSSSFHWIRNVHCKEETFDSPHAKHVCSLDLFCTPTVFSWGRHGSVLSLFEQSFTHKGVKKEKKPSFDAVVTVICIESGITGKLLHHLCLSIGVQFVKILPTHKGVSRREGFFFFIFTLGPLALLIQQNADPYTLDIDGKNNKQAFPWPNSILLTNKTTGRPTTKFQTFLTSSYRHVHVCWCACKLGVFSVCVLFWLSILLSSSGRLIKHRACQELPVAIVHWRINASGRSRALIIMPFPTYWLSLLPL